MLSKKIAVCAWGISAFCALGLFGCSDTQGTTTTSGISPASPTTVRVNEAELIAAVGSPVVSEVKLDDGRGLHFRPSKGVPAFTLEFRREPQRVNIAWQQFTDSPEQHEANKQNAAWAIQVLTYAIGADSAVKVTSTDKPLSFTQTSYKINVIPGEIQTLVTISPQ